MFRQAFPAVSLVLRGAALRRRITVQDIVIWHERLGLAADEIATEYGLSLADVYAALAYYFDHRAEIDQSIHDGDALVEALRESTPSKLTWVR